MPEFLKRLQQRVINFWKDLDKSQKTRICIIAGILAVAVSVGIYIMTRTNYAALISPTDQADVVDVKAALDTGKISYKSNGNTIMVPEKELGAAQALLVQKELPRSPDTIFEDALSKIQLSETESTTNKRIIDAQSKIIAARLKLFNYVEDASVTLVVPEDTYFLVSDTPSKPSASVMIKPRGELTKEQIHAVVMMVARSVDKLDPNDITVVDYNMNLLNDEPSDPSIGRADDQLALIEKYKESTKKQIYDLYQQRQLKAFDSMTVAVSPDINLDTNKQTIKKYENPSGTTDPSYISQSSKTQKVVNADGSTSTAGVGSNPGTTTTTYPNTTPAASTADTSDVTNNYIYNEYLTELQKYGAQYNPKNSHVAINLFYGNRATDITPQTIASVKQTVSDATGGIPIQNITVNKYATIKDVVPPVSAYDTVKSLFQDYGTFALILFLAIGLMIAALPKRRKEEEPLLELSGSSAAPVTAGPGPRFVVPETIVEDIPEIGIEEKSEVKKQINKFVKQKPDAVAQLLRNWLSDEWDM